MKDWIVPSLAIIVIGTIEFYALYLGINGTVLAVNVAIIGGIGGYKIKSKMVKK